MLSVGFGKGEWVGNVLSLLVFPLLSFGGRIAYSLSPTFCIFSKNTLHSSLLLTIRLGMLFASSRASPNVMDGKAILHALICISSMLSDSSLDSPGCHTGEAYSSIVLPQEQ